jgi:probable rRNA maturation factor
MAVVNFFSEAVNFRIPHPRKTSSWIQRIIKLEKFKLKSINFIFCSDEYLLKTNQEYLNHVTYTDIITFDNSESTGVVEGDIFISVDRVRENAQKFGQSFDEEMHRVLVHGVLHLMGYKDKSSKQKVQIRKKEDACLSLR